MKLEFIEIHGTQWGTMSGKKRQKVKQLREDILLPIDHFALRRSGRVTEFADPNTQLKTRLDAAVAMRVYSISAGRTLH